MNEKNFITVVTFIIQYIDKSPPIPSVKDGSFTQTRPAKWQKTSAICVTFKGKIELKKYSKE